MAEKLEVNPNTRIDQVGRTGIYPASGPQPPVTVPVRGQGELAHPEERRLKLLTSGTRTGTSAVLTLGRALFGGYFLYNGINHFVNRRMMSDYARSKQVPAAALAVPASGALIMLGGLSVLTGVQPKIGASLIATFLLSVSPQMHDFWNVEDPQQRMAEMVNFTKNMALVGAACLTAAIPEPWPMSPRLGTAA
jgi:putative oxidoreductase